MRGALFHQMMPSGQSKFEMAKMTNWGKMGDRQKPQWQRKIPVCDGTVAKVLAERLPPKERMLIRAKRTMSQPTR